MRLLFFTFYLLIASSVFSQSLDYRLLYRINQNEHPTWDKGMRLTSLSVFAAMPAAVILPFAQGIANKDAAMQRNAYKSAITIGLAAVCASGLKYAISRKRPYVQYPNDIIKRDHAGPYSFPSGHTTSAFATATALTLTYKKWYVGVPAYLYASLVGYSRMRLGMHFPTDVLGGMVIGIGAGFLTWKLDAVINKK
jgi:membrane-associated phospholipid phosphatase